MAKRVYEMNEDEKVLYNEIKRDIQLANSRIRNLEKLGIEDAFATKQLRDYLSAETLQALTQSGYISLKTSYKLPQLLGIKTAVENFLDEPSTLKQIYTIQKDYERRLDKQLDLRQVDILYKLETTYEWIYDYIPKSEFWLSFGDIAYRYSVETWIEQIGYRVPELTDIKFRDALESLYLYCTKE